MTQEWTRLLIFTSIPAVLMAIGGVFAFIKTPGAKTTSTIQHFAAGVVFSAVAVELLPKVIDQSHLLLSLGFIIGVATMLFTEWFARKLSKNTSSSNKIPIELLLAVGIDVLIDGILIGVSFIASSRSGIVIALALSLEVLFLGLSTSAKMAKNKLAKPFGIGITLLLALLIPIGGILGYGVVSQLAKPVHLMILSFGVAALLYLVTEELLLEAHEIEDIPFATMAFFAGFLVILLIS